MPETRYAEQDIMRLRGQHEADLQGSMCMPNEQPQTHVTILVK